MSAEPPRLYLKKNEERRIRAGHCWVYSNEVDNARSGLAALEPGQNVTVVDHRGTWLANGYANPHSLICARVVSRRRERWLGPELLRERLHAALALRERLYARPYYRWVYGETDGLPGLVIDRYADVVVAQTNTAGMERVREELVDAINEIAAPAAVVLRNDAGVRRLEGLELYTETAVGSLPEHTLVEEHGLRFHVSSGHGQKTGWYFDQHDNRGRLPALVAERRVLDLFSYVGAWGIGAAVHGASEALCVDSSGAALELARHNAQMNGVGERVRTLESDGFDALNALHADGERFDVVVIDPPAFIKRRKESERGLLAYRRLNQAALRVLTQGGVLISCSCSFHLAREQFVDTLRRAGLKAGRSLQLFAEGQQAPDHPVHPAMPETRYLKAAFARAPGRF